METIRYDRSHLSDTLARPLKRSTIDTISSCLATGATTNNSVSASRAEFVGELLGEIRDLRKIVTEAVKTWNPTPGQDPRQTTGQDEIKAFEGAWINRGTNSNLYARVIDNEVIAPYCVGANTHVKSVYYGWKTVGEFWFGRYRWLDADVSGFVFLKRESVDLLKGAWWSDDALPEVPECPNLGSGVSTRWERVRDVPFPDCALQFFDRVSRDGLVNVLARAKTAAQRAIISANKGTGS
jgi:hypothetical protein